VKFLGVLKALGQEIGAFNKVAVFD
jgi:hypothetical protein